MLAAGALLTGGRTVRSRELWAGCPAKFVRVLNDEAVAEMREGATRYAENAQRYLRDLRPA
jgi:carbonic anhydrase/acetyltransferase-like protein (isoleucine patch superfamily)